GCCWFSQSRPADSRAESGQQVSIENAACNRRSVPGNEHHLKMASGAVPINPTPKALLIQRHGLR
ncbi:MAG: hypothetical protein MUC91_13505, partial [Verrucomicrobia bacterium]|nr:hypothetical protein [Verrucomicrobiota bacterium]